MADEAAVNRELSYSYSDTHVGDGIATDDNTLFFRKFNKLQCNLSADGRPYNKRLKQLDKRKFERKEAQ